MVQSNIWTSLAMVSLYIFNTKYLPIIKFNPLYFIWLIIITILGYSFQQQYNTSFSLTQNIAFANKKNGSFKLIIILLVIAFIEISLLLIDYIFNKWLFITIVLSFIYKFSTPLVKNFRNIPFLKPSSISLTWIILSCILPLSSTGALIFSFPIINYLFFHFFFIYILCIPFDVKDIEKDKQNGLLTLPMITDNIFNKLIINVLLIFLYQVILYYKYLIPIDYLMSNTIILVLLLFALLIHKTQNYSSLTTYIVYDGLIIFYGIIGFIICLI